MLNEVIGDKKVHFVCLYVRLAGKVLHLAAGEKRERERERKRNRERERKKESEKKKEGKNEREKERKKIKNEQIRK